MYYNYNRRRYYFEEPTAEDLAAWEGLPDYGKAFYHGAKRGRGISNRIMARVALGARKVGHGVGGSLGVARAWGDWAGGKVRSKIDAIRAAREARRAARALG